MFEVRVKFLKKYRSLAFWFITPAKKGVVQGSDKAYGGDALSPACSKKSRNEKTSKNLTFLLDKAELDGKSKLQVNFCKY